MGRMTQQLWVDHLPQQGNRLLGSLPVPVDRGGLLRSGEARIPLLLPNSSCHFETIASVLLLHLRQIYVTRGRKLNLLKVAPTNPSSTGDVKRSLSGAAEFTKTIMAHFDAGA